MEDRAHAESWAPEEAGALYELGRPGYPDAAGAVLAERLGLGPGTRVADVAAGTGKLTRLLTRVSGGEVLAVEPMAGMRTQLRAACPTAAVVAGVAEALPFADGSLHAITVAQAFHWLRVPEAAADMRRALGPTGHLAVVSNRPRHEEPWQEQLWGTLRRYEQLRPRPATVRTWWDELRACGCFGPFERVELRHEQRFATLEQLDARMGSISHVLLLDEAERRAMFAEMHDIVGPRRPVVLPLRTVILVAPVAAP